MKLPKNLKVKSGVLAMIPWISNHTVQAIYPNIYVPKKIFQNLREARLSSEYADILRHEQEHIKRQRKMGIVRWGIKYVFSPKFRFEEEIAAIKVQKKIDVEKSARWLSSWVYLWMVSYKTVKRKLKEI